MCRTCGCSYNPCSMSATFRPSHRPDHPCDPYLPLTLCEPSEMMDCCMPAPRCCYPNCSQKNPPCRYSGPCKAHCYETLPCSKPRRPC
ncbi:keratin-associated protein 10-6-like [Episyrphus balteatus]|uniref:keratin-associated protein 10-6-like n=1 Tax=Episyrphus balteatus TaxID=286459 RepID=UPI00248540ED|nr:keratin-associated protein 10-6-like [Episyrphus balteatus]